jgi:hypothetical protein
MYKGSRPEGIWATGRTNGATLAQAHDDPFAADRSARLERPSATSEEGTTGTLRINDIAPDFEAESTEGTIRFHEWLGDGWGLFFSHPKDFTPVCTTELGAVAGLKDDFAARNCKVIGISVDGVADGAAWSSDIESATGNALNYP